MTKERNHIPQLESIQRISKIPVVETGVHMAIGLYGTIKNSNSLMKWYLEGVEGGVSFVVDKSFTAVPLLELPFTVADAIVCKGLDTVQEKVPAINYPPEKIIKETKDYVSTKLVQPVLKRAESAKEITIQGATKYGELAASRVDAALNVADKYVEKYLPDATDTTDGKAPTHNGESKAIQTIEHVNRLSRKLQRRLTKRTIAEARALRRQGIDTAQILFKLAELMVRDPKQFAAKMKAIWEHLSQDEPENQVPPANLEQLIAMLTRETARRFVHLTNYTVKKASKLPSYTMHTVQFLTHQANVILDEALKTVHLEGAKAIAISRAKNQIRNLNLTLRDVQILIENLVSGLVSSTQKHKARTPERPIPLHTLSPVAQSPERTQDSTKQEEHASTQANQETPSQENKPEQPSQQAQGAKIKEEDSTQQSKSSPKKQKKQKSSNNVNQQPTIGNTQSPMPSRPETPRAEDENSNNQPLANGGAPRSGE